MELKKLLSYTRQAVDDYKLIEEGDHIAVGISGGKDSLTLLYALAGLRRFYLRVRCAPKCAREHSMRRLWN